MFKVIWDSQSNGVQLTMSSKGEALNVSPRPVFWEELDLLGLNKMGWIYPHVDEPLLWACDRRYFYKGDFVLEVKGGNVFDAPTVIQQDGFESLILSANSGALNPPNTTLCTAPILQQANILIIPSGIVGI